MSQVEHEHTDTFTSTPRKRKRVATNRQASDSSLFGITNRTEANTSLDKSMVQSRVPEGVRIPVHTHPTTNTTSTTTASLFAQSRQVRTQQNTQTIFSTSCTSDHSHQVRTLPGYVTFATTQKGPVVTTIPQGTESTVAGMASTTHLQTATNIPPEMPAMGILQSTYNAQAALQQPPNQVMHMPMSHLSRQTPLIVSGVTHAAPLPISQPTHAAVQHAHSHAVNLEQPIIPSIQALRTTAVNQDLVQQRLQELNHLTLPHHQGNSTHYHLLQPGSTQVPNKPKGKNEKVDVVWPQHCAFVGHLRARVSYEQLTQAQFVLGFLRSVQEEQGIYIKGNMIEYLTELFQNVCDHNLQAAKGAHLVVMTKMEEGLITWGDLKKVNKVKKPTSEQPVTPVMVRQTVAMPITRKGSENQVPSYVKNITRVGAQKQVIMTRA